MVTFGVATNQQKTAGISILTGSQFTPDLNIFCFDNISFVLRKEVSCCFG